MSPAEIDALLAQARRLTGESSVPVSSGHADVERALRIAAAVHPAADREAFARGGGPVALLPEHLAQALKLVGEARWHNALGGRPRFEAGGEASESNHSNEGYGSSDNDSSSNSDFGGWSGGYNNFGLAGVSNAPSASSPSTGAGWATSRPAGSSTSGYQGMGGFSNAASVGGDYSGGPSYSSANISTGSNTNSAFSSLASSFSGGASNNSSRSAGSNNGSSFGSNLSFNNGSSSSQSNAIANALASVNNTNDIASALSIASSFGVGSPFRSSSSGVDGFGSFASGSGQGAGSLGVLGSMGASSPATSMSDYGGFTPALTTSSPTMPSFYNSNVGFSDYNAPQDSIDNAMRLAAGLGVNAFTKGPTSFGVPGLSGPGTDQAVDGFGTFRQTFKPVEARAESLADTTPDARYANMAGLLTGLAPSAGLPTMAALEGIAQSAYTRPGPATSLGPIALGSDRDSTLAHLGLYDDTPAQTGPVGSEIAPDDGYAFSPGVHLLEGDPSVYGETPAVTASPLQGSVDPLKAALAATWSPLSGTTLAGDGRLYGDASVGRAVPTSPVRQSLAEANQGAYTDATKFSPPAASYTLGNSYPALAFAGSTGATGLYGDKSATGSGSADSSTTGDPASVDGTRALTVHGLDAAPTGFSDTAQFGAGLPAQLPGYTSASPVQVASMIAASAIQRHIDPDTAVKVARSEGLGSAGYVGDNGSSFGPLQMHYGSVAGAGAGNQVTGMGDDFTAQTGLDARDPSTIQAQIDFALDSVAKNQSWAPFHGASAAGIGVSDGIGVDTSRFASADIPARPQAPVAGDYTTNGVMSPTQAAAYDQARASYADYTAPPGLASALALAQRINTQNIGTVSDSSGYLSALGVARSEPSYTPTFVRADQAMTQADAAGAAAYNAPSYSPEMQAALRLASSAGNVGDYSDRSITGAGLGLDAPDASVSDLHTLTINPAMAAANATQPAIDAGFTSNPSLALAAAQRIAQSTGLSPTDAMSHLVSDPAFSDVKAALTDPAGFAKMLAAKDNDPDERALQAKTKEALEQVDKYGSLMSSKFGVTSEQFKGFLNHPETDANQAIGKHILSSLDNLGFADRAMISMAGSSVDDAKSFIQSKLNEKPAYAGQVERQANPKDASVAVASALAASLQGGDVAAMAGDLSKAAASLAKAPPAGSQANAGPMISTMGLGDGATPSADVPAFTFNGNVWGPATTAVDAPASSSDTPSTTRKLYESSKKSKSDTTGQKVGTVAINAALSLVPGLGMINGLSSLLGGPNAGSFLVHNQTAGSPAAEGHSSNSYRNPGSSPQGYGSYRSVPTQAEINAMVARANATAAPAAPLGPSAAQLAYLTALAHLPGNQDQHAISNALALSAPGNVSPMWFNPLTGAYQ